MEEEESYNVQETDDPSAWSDRLPVSQLCRICANPNDFLISIFEGEGSDHELGMKINKHLPIQVCEDDELPKHICYQCASTLIAWHDMVITCISADNRIRQLYKLEQEESTKNDDQSAEFFDDAADQNTQAEDECIEQTSSDRLHPISQDETKLKKVPTSRRANVGKERKSKRNTEMKISQSGLTFPGTTSKTVPGVEIANQKKDTPEQVAAAERSRQPTFKTFLQTQVHDPVVKISSGCENLELIKCKEFGTKNISYLKKNPKISLSLFGVRPASMRKLPPLQKVDDKYVSSDNRSEQVEKEEIKSASLCSETSSQGCSKTKGNVLKSLRTKCTMQMRNLKSAKKNTVCDICGRIFSRIYHLKRHRRIHKIQVETPSKEEIVFRCDLCGKILSCKSTLRAHQIVHSGEKLTCHICGKRFSQTGLHYHLKHVHGGVKNHTCDICGRGFAVKPAMEDHRRTHTGERPYVCSTCGKSFKTRATLYIHNKTHTDVYPYSCSYCHKLFRNQHELVKHLVTHTGDRPHTCSVCGRGFRARNEMTRHRMLHSDDKPFVCSACGLGFKQERYLKRHMKAHHPGTVG
ncbi:zinc finger protein 300 isoform X2 [Anabrus simplex]|uniref:zinc finger protein 300 isoform X2 n=1 Tax=Anabrus simplex TaxID=316456 RepID=UPI0035A27AFE